jgi:hypothetical protein
MGGAVAVCVVCLLAALDLAAAVPDDAADGAEGDAVVELPQVGAAQRMAVVRSVAALEVTAAGGGVAHRYSFRDVWVMGCRRV